MSRVAPDFHDQIIWNLNETSGVYRNTGVFLPNNAATDLTPTNTIIRTSNGPFQDNCLHLPGTDNFPVGSSATRNYVSGANTFNPAPPFTMSGWVWVRSYTASNNATLFGKAYRDQNITSTWTAPFLSVCVNMSASSTGDWTVRTALNSTTAATFTITDFPIPLFQWCHVGITHDGTVIRAYLNGCQCIYYSGATQLNTVAAATQSYTDGTNGFGPWFIGAIPATGSGNKEEGNYMIQDVRVANVARSLQYFKSVYKVGVLPLNLSSLVQYYKLRTYDLGCSLPTPVTWVDTQVSLANAPVFTCGGPYSPVEVLDSWYQ